MTCVFLGLYSSSSSGVRGVRERVCFEEKKNVVLFVGKPGSVLTHVTENYGRYSKRRAKMSIFQVRARYFGDWMSSA